MANEITDAMNKIASQVADGFRIALKPYDVPDDIVTNMIYGVQLTARTATLYEILELLQRSMPEIAEMFRVAYGLQHADTLHQIIPGKEGGTDGSGGEGDSRPAEGPGSGPVPGSDG